MSREGEPSPSPIFGDVYEQWPRIYGGVTFNEAAFERRLSRCDLAVCRGMCCYDGVYVEPGVQGAINTLVEERGSDLAALGAELDDEIFVEGIWRGEVLGTKTAVRPFPFRTEVTDFPAHFSETICVFNDGRGHCTLQLLAVKDGRHAWDYKPPTCWLHPIDLDEKEVSLANADTDPNNFTDYPGYVSRTTCGRTQACGHPAKTVLSEELRYLEGLLKRPLISEFVSS